MSERRCTMDDAPRTTRLPSVRYLALTSDHSTTLITVHVCTAHCVSTDYRVHLSTMSTMSLVRL